MKREELLAKGYTEEQVTDLLNTFHQTNAENEKLHNEIEKKKNVETEYEKLKKKLDDIDKANMSEQERLEQMKKEAEENLANSRRIYNTAKVKEILAEYDVEESLIERLVSDDENKSVESANMFKNRLDTLISDTTKKVQDSIANANVKPTPSNIPQGEQIMTKEKFRSMTMTEQVIWKRENEEQYNELFNK